MRYVRGGVAMCHNVGIAMVEGMMKPEQSLLLVGCDDAGMRNGEIGRVSMEENQKKSMLGPVIWLRKLPGLWSIDSLYRISS